MVHTQSIVPPSLRTVILKEVHDNLGHLGVKKTLGHVKPASIGLVMNKLWSHGLNSAKNAKGIIPHN